jgi:uncharacterized protein (DUF305 family)
MTADHLPHSKPWLYALGGLIVGTVGTLIVTSLLFYPRSSFEYFRPMMNPAARPGIASFRGDANQHFIVMMIPHHQDAIDMADVALTRTQRPEIKKLAESIKATQTQEIQQMRSLYQRWYNTEVPDDLPGMGMGMRHRWHRDGDQRSSMNTDLTALENASDFDREFLAQMIPHHQMAIMMSTMVLRNEPKPELQALAQSMIDSQSAEIKQMQEWYQEWY